MTSWATEYFGEQLQTKDGLKPTVEALANKSRIGIYFSAHWCPPCRGFTPVLAEFYEQLKEENGEALEIIFVSSDRDQASFEEYYGSMPWLALDFSNRDVKQKLAEKFGVSGIPFFVVLDAADGSVKDDNARSTVVNSQGVTSKATAVWA